MKTIKSLLFILAVVLISACEGPIGPTGPRGPQGEPGVNILGNVFEITGDFTAEGNYTLSYLFPGDFERYDSDVVLVYILWETTEEGTDVWRLLPQTVVLKDEITGDVHSIQYNFDYTLDDVQIYIEGTLPPDQYLPAETDNQVFRIAVLPADFAAQKSLDIGDLNDVMRSLNINPNTLQKIQ